MRNRSKLSALGLLLAAYGCSAPSGATGSIDMLGLPSAPALAAAAPLPNGKAMPDSMVVASAPPGFVSFCLRFPDQCAITTDGPSVVTLSPAQQLALQKINDAVNLAIKPMDDARHYGRAEYWTIPADGFGDCEDYALTKRRDLIAAGFPAQALRIAVVLDRRNERHAVLTVATDQGDYVLDNLTNNIRSWDDTDYKWIERQDPGRAWGWVSLDPARGPVATSIAAGPVSAFN